MALLGWAYSCWQLFGMTSSTDYTFLSAFSSWVYTNARWLDGVLMGAGLGAFLALVQPWLMRWRYGFVPRFWRIATFIGASLGGALFSEFIYSNGYYDSNGFWTYPNQIAPIGLWLSCFNAGANAGFVACCAPRMALPLSQVLGR